MPPPVANHASFLKRIGSFANTSAARAQHHTDERPAVWTGERVIWSANTVTTTFGSTHTSGFMRESTRAGFSSTCTSSSNLRSLTQFSAQRTAEESSVNIAE
ncbi:MAG: hypothetical protein QOD00_2895 [Blastocatellia bacterium]|nr:hypothetical protein [Blastocatellia bacterium]